MKVAFLLLFFIGFLQTPAQSQGNRSDDMAANPVYTTADSAQLKKLVGLVEEFEKTDAKKTETYALQLLELAMKLGNKSKIIKAQLAAGHAFLNQTRPKKAVTYFNEVLLNITDSAAYVNTLRSACGGMGRSYVMLSEFKTARFYYQRALTIATKQGSLWNIAGIEFDIADCFLAEKDYTRAVVYYQQAESSYEKVKFQTGIIKSIVATGNAYLSAADDNQALYNFKKALEKAKANKNSRDLGYTKTALAHFYFEKDFFRETYNWQREALFHYQDAKDTANYAQLCSDFGLTLLELDSTAAALEQQLKALEFFKTIKNPYSTANCLNILGNLYTTLIGDKKAIAYLEEAAKINESISNEPNLIINLLNISQIYLKKKDYKKVITPATKAFEVAEKINLKPQIIKAAELLSVSYTALKQYQKALKYEQISKQTNIAIDSQKIEKLYIETQKDRDKYRREARRTAQYLVWRYVSLGLGVLVLALSFWVWRLLKAQKKLP